MRHILFFILVSTTVAFSAAQKFDLGSLPSVKLGKIVLAGKSAVTLASMGIPGARVEFVDPYPRANWGHPAYLRVISSEGKILEEVRVNRPPTDLTRAKSLSEFTLPVVTPVKVTLKPNEKFRVKESKKHFALLINGNASQRHWNDYSFLFQTLQQIYGYDKENIFVADSFHKAERPDLDGDGAADILFESTVDGVRKLFGTLKEKLSADTDLLVVVNDHGEVKNGESILVLNDGEILASEFAKLLKGLPSKRTINVFQQCFGGGFVRPTVGEYRVSLAASTNQEFSWATKDMQFDEFLYHWTAAIAGQRHDGSPLTSDLNRDGRISVSEAFSFAVAMDTTAENPVLESYPNSGFDKLLGLFL